jgi:hypothetical protein
VFTARYALSPCIKEIRLVFKGLNKEEEARVIISLFLLTPICVEILTVSYEPWQQYYACRGNGAGYKSRQQRAPHTVLSINSLRRKKTKLNRHPTFGFTVTINGKFGLGM